MRTGGRYAAGLQRRRSGWGFAKVINPRDVEHAWFVPEKAGTVDAGEFAAAIYTSNLEAIVDERPGCYFPSDLYSVPPYMRHYPDRKSPSVPALEQAYAQYYPEMNYEATRTLLFRLEYRTAGITDLKITADRSLFGEEPGTPLNSCFRIEPFSVEPDCQLSYDGYRLLSPPREPFATEDLDEWLSWKPLAPARMVVRFRDDRMPRGVDRVTFTLSMTTTAGKQLTARLAGCSFR